MSDKTQTFCSNEDHIRPVPAVAKLSWPDGRFRPTTACRSDLRRILLTSLLDEKQTVLVEPIEHDHGNLTEAMKKVARLHRRAYSEPVKAIVLEAPDMPSFEELPESLEKRQKLPARFHIPQWDGDGMPHAWLCAVCWEEGVTSQWPCTTAYEQGGEVFAR
jgi:hypothetical protein